MSIIVVFDTYKYFIILNPILFYKIKLIKHFQLLIIIIQKESFHKYV